MYKKAAIALYVSAWDEDEMFALEDSVTILYSSKTPGMSKIKEVAEYYGK